MEPGREGADGGDVLVVALDIKRCAAEGFCVRGELFVLIKELFRRWRANIMRV